MTHPTAYGVHKALASAERCGARAATGPNPLSRKTAAAAAAKWRAVAGYVLCSWCAKRAYYSLWSAGWPEQWLGDACFLHRSENGRHAGRVARIA